jgi:4-hydroxybenzoate polyprenyltransferase
MQRVSGLLENTRSNEWWEFKIPPLLATAYAMALLLHLSFQQLWPLLLMFFCAIVPTAVYVCVINDITDLEDDRLCGKSNRMEGKSAAFQFFALVVCIVPGLIMCWFFRHYPMTLAFYIANWLTYTLYSVPPFRLKVRGIWGVAMDASGAHLTPTVWTACLIAEATGHPIPWLFLVALAVWALTFGLRGILWHQLLDRDNDRRGEVTTFVARRDPMAIRRFVYFVSFPLEVATLAYILIRVDTPWAWVMLAVYLVVEWLIHRLLAVDLILVQPTPRFRILLGEYYQLQYPLTFLIALTAQDIAAGCLILLQLVMFPHCLRVFLRNLNYLIAHRLGNAVLRRGKAVMLLIRGTSH